MDEKMKIMYDYQAAWLQKYGGISRYYYEMLTEIRKLEKGIEIDMPIVAANNVFFQNDINYQQWNCKLMERILNEIWTTFKILFRNLKREYYDIVHPTFYLPLVWNKFVSYKKTKLVVTIYDMIHEKYICEDKRLIKNKLKLLEAADGIIAISQYTKMDMIKIYPQLKHKEIEVIYLGSSMGKVKPEVVDIPEMYLLFVGNREGYKNFVTLVKALPYIVKSIKTIKLVCAGGGEFSKKERNLLNINNVEQNVIHISANDSQLAYLYQHAMCFIFPSLCEGFGIPILEAFYWKCPVVLSNCSCFPEVAGEAAVYFEGENFIELSSQIYKVICDKKLRDTMINLGLIRLGNYSWENTAKETYEFYQRLLDKKVDL